MTAGLVAMVGLTVARAQETGGRAVPSGREEGGCGTPDFLSGSPIMGLSSGTPWPGGVVYYTFDAAVTSANRTRMLNAFATISAAVNVTFTARTNQAAYVTVRNATATSGNLSSAIGRTGAQQFVYIQSWTNAGILMHEMMHVLGMRHEQARSDRDSYVSINSPKINPPNAFNFDVQGGTTTGPYDFLSLMHYTAYDFSLDGDRTIDMKWPYALYWQYAIGRQTQVSAGDAAALRAIYGGTTRPDYFQLQSPAHGEFVGTTTPTLTWSASNGADDYVVEIGTDQFSARIIHTAVVAGTSYSVPAGILAPNQEYIWRAKARNAKGLTGAMPIPSRILSTRATAPAVVYVDASAPAGGDGSSWNSAYQSVHRAENLAFALSMSDPAGPGIEVRMAGGTYRADDGTNNRFLYLPLDSGLRLLGGYAGRNAPDPDERDLGAHETVLSGDILGNDTEDPATRADNSYWLAIASISNQTPVVDGITFRGAASENDIGGAVVSDTSGLIVRRCRFESNRAAYYGCGLTAVYGGSIDVSDSVFEGNYAYNNPATAALGAAGAYFRAGVTFDRTKFLGNSGTSGSALSAYDSSVEVYNSLFAGNAASGIVNAGSTEAGTIAARFFSAGATQVQIVNATMTQNTAPANSQSTLFASSAFGAEPMIRNSILWGNSAGLISGEWTAEASLIEGGFGGTGVFDADPGFANSGAGDYTLAAGSPAIDAGDGAFLSVAHPLDLAGNARVTGGAPDLGAYERGAACAGDLNSDGLVEDSDFVIFAAAYDLLDCQDPSMPAGCPADLNADGIVDDSDFVLFAAAYDQLVCP